MERALCFPACIQIHRPSTFCLVLKRCSVFGEMMKVNLVNDPVKMQLDLAQSSKVVMMVRCGAVVFPLVAHPFVVGFLFAEQPKMILEKELHDIKEHLFHEKSFSVANNLDLEPLGFPTLKHEPVEMMKFTRDQILNSINITKSLAVAYFMDRNQCYSSNHHGKIIFGDLFQEFEL